MVVTDAPGRDLVSLDDASGARHVRRAGLVDAWDPFSPAQFGPSATDARHRITFSGVWSPGAGLTIAPVFRFRTKLPSNISAGSDLKLDGFNFGLPPGVATVNGGRGASFSQLDVRISKVFSPSVGPASGCSPRCST
jgi:hypothetical protein